MVAWSFDSNIFSWLKDLFVDRKKDKYDKIEPD